MDKSREQFEAWANHAFGEDEVQLDMDDEGEYTDGYDVNYVNDAWDVWQASREAIEVELPNKVLAQGIFDSGRNFGIDLCAESITTLGLKVKP